MDADKLYRWQKPRGHQGWLGTSGKKKHPRHDDCKASLAIDRFLPHTDQVISSTWSRIIDLNISEIYSRNMKTIFPLFAALSSFCLGQAKGALNNSDQTDLQFSGLGGSGSGFYIELENYWSIHHQSNLDPWMIGIGAGVLFPLGLHLGIFYSGSPVDQVYIEETAPLQYAQNRDKVSQIEFRPGINYKPLHQMWEIGFRGLFSKLKNTQDGSHKISEMQGNGFQIHFAIPALSVFLAYRSYSTTSVSALGFSIPLGLRNEAIQ